MPTVYHVINGPIAFPFDADARHAVSHFPGEWSRTPWPAASPVIDKKPDITREIADLTDRTIAFRIVRAKTMDRLTTKLEAAAGVVGRVSAQLEARADSVIAREAAISKRSEQLFAAKNSVLDAADAGLNGIEAKLAMLSNDPFEPSAPSPSAPSSPPSSEVPT